ncbi:MAG: hypothetical protein M1820_002424 [Bogoriella megaspora]|nr:MAG: hypothetical protein M1820_002424 [Bogoriella megaspora]
MSSEYGVSVHATITIDPRNEQQFLAALRPAFDAVVAEPECTFCEIYKNTDKPGQFRFVENWRASKEWVIEVQLQKQYYKPYAEATKPLWVEPLKLEFFERSAPEWRVMKMENTSSPMTGGVPRYAGYPGAGQRSWGM